MNPVPAHHQAIRDQYSPASGTVFYRTVMGDGAPVIHYGIYQNDGTSMREATETATRRLMEIARCRADRGPLRDIIDLGAGPGGPAHLLATATGAVVTCADLCEHHNRANEDAARALGIASRIHTWTGSFENLPADWSARFDLAWSQEALCHAQDKSAALREALRVLRPGGTFVFSDILLSPDAPPEDGAAFSKVNAVTRLSTAADHLRDLADIGFGEIEHHDWTTHLNENFRRMRIQIDDHRAQLLADGVPAGLLDRFAASLDQRIAWPAGSVLQWAAFAGRR
jgi:SAM-dependent methyltransferase